MLTGGKGRRAVVWFRRDLRIRDNRTVAHAGSADALVGLFVWDPLLVRTAGARRLEFLRRSIAALDSELGGRLVIRSGAPEAVVPEVAREAGAAEVWCARDFAPYGRQRDRAVELALGRSGRRLFFGDTPYAVPPGEVLSGRGQPFRVFTPYRRAWLTRGWPASIEAPDAVASFISLPGEPIAAHGSESSGLPAAGEGAAHIWLAEALAGADSDAARPDVDGTTRLSAHLRFGCLHPRQVLNRLDPTNPAHRRLESELCWREFYADVLFHNPSSARQPLANSWLEGAVDAGPDVEERFARWREGTTGYPFIDAGMRQLATEGWIHNRVRMATASFLVKDLHLDWRWGARWFMEQLVDGDLASNQHNWQWVAGTGTDAAPYFRIFNPVRQSLRFDPQGDYIKRWVPELGALDPPAIHEPWRRFKRTSTATPRPSVTTYPAPIVDHDTERRVSLARYDTLRRSTGSSKS